MGGLSDYAQYYPRRGGHRGNVMIHDELEDNMANQSTKYNLVAKLNQGQFC